MAEFARGDSAEPPISDTASATAAYGSSPEQKQRLHDALRRLKTIMGVGEAPTLVLRPFAAGAVSGGGDAGEVRTVETEKSGGNVLALDLARNVWGQKDASQLRVGDVVKVFQT